MNIHAICVALKQSLKHKDIILWTQTSKLSDGMAWLSLASCYGFTTTKFD